MVPQISPTDLETIGRSLTLISLRGCADEVSAGFGSVFMYGAVHLVTAYRVQPP